MLGLRRGGRGSSQSRRRSTGTIFPRPGWVEHDAGGDLGATSRSSTGRWPSRAITGRPRRRRRSPTSARPTLLWDKASGKPIAQRHRLAGHPHRPLVRELGGDGGQDRFRDICGLPLATYFSGPKMPLAAGHGRPAPAPRAERGEVLFGTMDSWLIWKLTGRHVTDVTNASRTHADGPGHARLERRLLAAFGVPRAMLPEIRPSCGGLRRGDGGALEGVPVAARWATSRRRWSARPALRPGEGNAPTAPAASCW